MQRRRFLQVSVLSFGALAAGCATEDEEPSLDEALFPQSIASGDPRADSVIVWTRVELEGESKALLRLQFGASADLSDAREIEVEALASYDGCVKARVEGLSSNTTYYYRFIRDLPAGPRSTVIGRTKTAPATDEDVPVRFCFVSCQDFVGRYYNNYLKILELDPDFLVHLGDYIYETTGDPRFQSEGTEDRQVELRHPEDAIALGEEESPYFAARSLDNYRDLYRIVRSDAALRAVHENVPMIAIWDDHEYSDDCWGTVATYGDPEVGQDDPERRRNASQAWFEYMPVDYRGDESGESFAYDPEIPFPEDIKIWRGFEFGRHLSLAMTDARIHRTDHPVPERALPGEVTMTQAELDAVGAQVDEFTVPLVDPNMDFGGAWGAFLDEIEAAAGIAEFERPALMSAGYLNDLLEDYGDNSASPPAPIDLQDPNFPRGISWFEMGKRDVEGSIGSRMFVVKPLVEAYLAHRWAADPSSIHVHGDEQQEWFLDFMESASSTWKLWGNEMLVSPIRTDLRALASGTAFANEYLVSLDFWDGHRPRADEILTRLREVENAVIITGDVHAFFAGVPGPGEQSGIPEFTTSSISSDVFRDEILKQIDSSPLLSEFDAASTLAEVMDFLLTNPDAGPVNPHLGWADSTSHGFGYVELDGETLSCSFYRLAPEDISEDLADKPQRLERAYSERGTERFRVRAGVGDLEREIDGSWHRWERDTQSWDAL